MQILIKDQALEKTLEEIASAYRAVCPGEYAAFMRIVDQDSKALLKPTGMSRDGYLMDAMRFPGTLYPFVKQQMRKRHGIPDFFADKKNYRLLMKVWSEACLKRKSTKILHIKSKE